MSSRIRQQLALLDQQFVQNPIPVETTSDADVLTVADELTAQAGGRELLGQLVGHAIRNSFDQVYDGQRTGRFHLSQLSKTEKTNTGSLVEIWLARLLRLADGRALDFCIAGHDVDCKFSFRDGGWMLPPEVLGSIAILVTADDYSGQWSLGLLRITEDRTRNSRNRDAKTSLSASGRSDITWLFRHAKLPSNVLLALPPADTIAIMRKEVGGRTTSGQQRLDELFTRCLGQRISRTVIATVAQQDDFMKRVRSNGGSRSRLAPSGYLLLGHYARHQRVAKELDLPIPVAGEIVSIRVARYVPKDASAVRTEIDGQSWRLWRAGDPVIPAPELPHR